MTTLAELRQASLKEQKQKEQSNRAPEAAPAAPAETLPPTPAPPVSAAPVASPNGNGHHAPTVVSTPPSAPVEAPVPAAAPAPPPSPEAVKAEKYFAQLHEALSHKTLHPSGAKVSADMPPALFHRAKRYCLDHGNITLRQVLIELLTAYLEEEGY